MKIQLPTQCESSKVASELLNGIVSSSDDLVLATEALAKKSTLGLIKSAFDETSDITGSSKALASRITSFFRKYIAKPNNISFWGGNLLGVDHLRFYPEEREEWFDEVIHVDEEHLKDKIQAINPKDAGSDAPDLKSWAVGGDTFNLSIIWVIYMLNKLPKSSAIYEAQVSALNLLQLKLLSSIYAHQFKKPVDPEAAEATYAALSLKFRIRRLGSWGAVIRDLSESLLERTSPHRQAFKDLNNDRQVVYAVTDVSTRLRSTISDQYAILDQIRAGNLRIQTTDSQFEFDGTTIIKDMVNSYNIAKDYLDDVSGNKESFIKPELIQLVIEVIPSASRQAFIECLEIISQLPDGKYRKETIEIMNDTLLHAFDYIATNRIEFHDIGYIMKKMKALYTSSKTSDNRLISLRRRLEKFIKRNTHLRASSALASVRTALMLYFLVRALSSNIYS